MVLVEKKILDLNTARWPAGRSLEEDLGHWKIAYVKPRNEKALAADCERMEVGYYLPLYAKRTRRKDTGKMRKSVLPLFSGYFPFVDRDESRLKVLETNRIVNFISIRDQEKFVHDLAQVWQALQAGVDLLPETTFLPGQKVRVLEGPLQGLIGTVENTISGRRLILTVDEFRMSVSVQLHQDEVAPLPRAEASKPR